MHGRRRLLSQAPLSAGWICRRCRSGCPGPSRRGFADGRPGGPSIFDQLFPQEKPHKPYSLRPPKPSTPKPLSYPRAREPEAESGSRPGPRPGGKDGPGLFIYEELFPEEKKKAARAGGEQGRGARQPRPGPARAGPLGDWGANRRVQRRGDDGAVAGAGGPSEPEGHVPASAGPPGRQAGGAMADDELRRYRSFVLGDRPALEGGGDGGAPRDRRAAERRDERPADPWVVLQLASASASLLESDFHRLAPQGQHLEGWVGGLKKVLQAHDPTTSEPLGQYYLFFETPGAARAYAEEARRLHALWRRRLPGPASPPRGGGAGPGRAHAFSLVPPAGDLDLRTLRYGRRLVDEMARKTTLQGVFYRHHLPAARREARVLLALDGPGRGQGQHQLLTPAAVRAAIDEDGRGRGLPWRLAPAAGRRPSVVPVVRSADAGGAPEGPEGPEEEASARFLVTFADADEARRFVRGWHRRLVEEVYDEDKVHSVRVNATVIW